MTNGNTDYNLGYSLGKSIGKENLSNVLTSAGDTALSIAMSAENIAGIPIFGALFGIFKTGKDIKNELFFRKIVRFLAELSSVAQDKREEFIRNIEENGKINDFGENILLLLERIDDNAKPTIIGRIMAAHISGHLAYEVALRLCAIVNRCYVQDLDYLKNFKEGTQGKNYPIADALFSAGLLSNSGIDGGTFSDPDSGGTIYSRNEYGDLLCRFGLQ